MLDGRCCPVGAEPEHFGDGDSAESVVEDFKTVGGDQCGMSYATRPAQTQQFFARGNDPSSAVEGTTVLWMTSGGDLKAKVTVGGVTKTATLVDFSSL